MIFKIKKINLNKNFNKYNAEELERTLIESQKSKFGTCSNNQNEDIQKLNKYKIGQKRHIFNVLFYL